MPRLPKLVALAVCVLSAQVPEVPPAWKEFSLSAAALLAPKGPPVNANSNIRQGIFHSQSITLKSLIEVATGVPWIHIEGPQWLDTEHYAIAAELTEESRLRLRTRAPAS